MSSSWSALAVSISIHALREEGDLIFYQQLIILWLFLSTPSARRATDTGFLRAAPTPNFYPRPPRGGRLQTQTTARLGDQFLSTPSARRATHSHQRGFSLLHDFYPRPPRGGRLHKRRLRDVLVSISIHALREEGDVVVLRYN